MVVILIIIVVVVIVIGNYRTIANCSVCIYPDTSAFYRATLKCGTFYYQLCTSARHTSELSRTSNHRTVDAVGQDSIDHK